MATGRTNFVSFFMNDCCEFLYFISFGRGTSTSFIKRFLLSESNDPPENNKTPEVASPKGSENPGNENSKEFRNSRSNEGRYFRKLRVILCEFDYVHS